MWSVGWTQIKMDEIQTKVVRIFLLAIESHLYSFALRFLFLQTHATSYCFFSALLYTVKEKGGKPDRKPHLLPYGLRNPKNRAQDYAQKPQGNCTFMNSASVLVSGWDPGGECGGPGAGVPPPGGGGLRHLAGAPSIFPHLEGGTMCVHEFSLCTCIRLGFWRGVRRARSWGPASWRRRSASPYRSPFPLPSP
jgi:hypothetical protein